jgi:hypothetical protein
MMCGGARTAIREINFENKNRTSLNRKRGRVGRAGDDVTPRAPPTRAKFLRKAANLRTATPNSGAKTSIFSE